jgi:hypothetical protein
LTLLAPRAAPAAIGLVIQHTVSSLHEYTIYLIDLTRILKNNYAKRLK